MSVDNDILKIKQACKNLWDVCAESWIDTAFIISVMSPKDENYPPFVSCTIGDYDFKFDEADGFTASYQPRGGKAEDYICVVDPARIVSFTMPPKQGEP